MLRSSCLRGHAAALITDCSAWTGQLHGSRKPAPFVQVGCMIAAGIVLIGKVTGSSHIAPFLHEVIILFMRSCSAERCTLALKSISKGRMSCTELLESFRSIRPGVPVSRALLAKRYTRREKRRAACYSDVVPQPCTYLVTYYVVHTT